MLWAVYADSGQVTLRHSSDLGATWSSPVAVNPAPEAIATYSDARPKIAFGRAAELYVTWTRARARPHTGDVRFSRSLDGGRTYSAPVTVNTDRQELMHEFESIAVNRTGQVFVVWLDKRDQAAARAKGSAYAGAALYFSVSDDGGASFRGDFRLAEHSCECCRIALLANDGGSVLAFWRHVFDPDIRDHALAELHPDGRTAVPRRATFDDWRTDACPHHGPSLAIDDSGILHAVWFSQAPERAGVMYGRLHDGGVGVQRRIGADTAEHADLAASGQRIAIAWKEFDGERTLLRGMRSDDAGTSWREFALASTGGASDQPRVLVRQGRFYAFWNSRAEPLRVVPFP